MAERNILVLGGRKLRSVDEISHNGKSLRDILEAHRAWARSGGKEGQGAKLERADLSDADLTSVDLSQAILIGTRFNRARMLSTRMNGAWMIEADLSGAYMIATDLTGADLTGAKMGRATLNVTQMHGTELRRASMEEAQMAQSVIVNCDLSEVIGLETVIHNAPSSIGVDTILMSQGKISEVFLRGAGVPDLWITYAKSLIANPIEFYSCFISHSSNDQEFCDRLYADLQAKSVRCWYFPEDATWGKSVWEEIDQAVKVYDKLVVVCSEASLKSGPVNREIERALQREDRENREVLFPIRIDDYLFEKWEHPRKADVIAKVVGDFRDWKTHDAFKKNFDKLLKALNRKQT